MKYNVGDKVRIKSLDWYNENKTVYGDVWFDNAVFVGGQSLYCGCELTIRLVTDDHYYVIENDYYWTDEMIEGLAEEEVLLNIDDFQDDNEIIDVIDEYVHRLKNNECQINLPEGYQFTDENGNVINATKIVLEKKKKSMIREEQIDNAAQEYIDSDNAVLTYSDGFCEQTDHPFVRAAFKAGAEWADNDVTQDDSSKAPKLTSQDYSNGRFGYQLPAGFKAKLTERELILTPEKPEYPKSLLDCESVLNGVRNDRKKLLHKFNELLVARDAYWKIAGEETGLGKPWEPSRGSKIYFIGYILSSDKLIKDYADDIYANVILTFPTAEMRDAFYENFKELIESVKELL